MSGQICQTQVLKAPWCVPTFLSFIFHQSTSRILPDGICDFCVPDFHLTIYVPDFHFPISWLPRWQTTSHVAPWRRPVGRCRGWRGCRSWLRSRWQLRCRWDADAVADAAPRSEADRCGNPAGSPAYLGVSMGVPLYCWMVQVRENPTIKWMMTGGTPTSGNLYLPRESTMLGLNIIVDTGVDFPFGQRLCRVWALTLDVPLRTKVGQ